MYFDTVPSANVRYVHTIIILLIPKLVYVVIEYYHTVFQGLYQWQTVDPTQTVLSFSCVLRRQTGKKVFRSSVVTMQ